MYLQKLWLISVDHRISPDTTTILLFSEQNSGVILLEKCHVLESLSFSDLNKALSRLIAEFPISPSSRNRPTYSFVKTAYFWELDRAFEEDCTNSLLEAEQLEVAFKKYFKLQREGLFELTNERLIKSLNKFNGEYQSLNSQARAFLAALWWFKEKGFRGINIF
ncbi:hypothetical protein Riv7116_6933 (plasmid) [Rivularia sp. PCC 7116]|uniref:hypothetical protein n=1 Tax=Rivularia sp. PCC 7116 TaxID=373994 RepID=UPI00029F2B69|nr:hypothetical protein [Rivularia sp. PCC 7116]AFY59245.1 hypothetical protein Riv7116_6933 [Rivularia sp. PCC 7116]